MIFSQNIPVSVGNFRNLDWDCNHTLLPLFDTSNTSTLHVEWDVEASD